MTAARRLKVIIMQIDVISRPPAEAQAARAAGLPATYIQIAGSPDELDKPRNLIREAARTIAAGKALGQKPAETALKAFGLIFAASLRAQKLRDWSTTGDYAPLPDFLAIQALATATLGTSRGHKHPVTQLHAALAVVVRELQARVAS